MTETDLIEDAIECLKRENPNVRQARFKLTQLLGMYKQKTFTPIYFVKNGEKITELFEMN